MRADPFAIMRRKQSRAQAFDFKREAETGALAHVQRLQEDIQAQHVSEDFLELPEEKKDERRLQRKLRRMEIDAIKADRKDLEKWKKEDAERKEAVQKKLEMIEKLRKSGEVISDKEAAAMVASIPPLGLGRRTRCRCLLGRSSMSERWKATRWRTRRTSRASRRPIGRTTKLLPCRSPRAGRGPVRAVEIIFVRLYAIEQMRSGVTSRRWVGRQAFASTQVTRNVEAHYEHLEAYH